MSSKILLILDKMIRAGTQKHILHLLQGMGSSWEFHVVCLEGRGPWDQKIRLGGGHLHVYALNRLYDVSGWQTIWGLASLIREIKPVGIETFMFTAHIVGCLAACLAGGVPVISSRREKVLWRRPIHFFLRQWANRFVTEHVANSHAVFEDIVEHEHVDPQTISIIPNGLDWQECQQKKTLRGIDMEKTNLVVLAALKPVKGHRLVVDMLGRFQESFENVIFHFLGDGPEKSSLQEMINQRNLQKHFIFHGFVDSAVPYLWQFDFCVHPSQSEGLSNSLIEAQASGLPVVAFKVDGNCEVIEYQRTGYLIEKNDLSHMAQVIKILCQDKILRRKMGREACRLAQKRYSISKMCELKSKIYRRVFQC